MQDRLLRALAEAPGPVRAIKAAELAGVNESSTRVYLGRLYDAGLVRFTGDRTLRDWQVTAAGRRAAAGI